MSFLRYPHLVKFGNLETENIEFGVTHIFPKLDGTNGQMWFNWTKPHIGFGSRNRTLHVESDNAGFLNTFLGTKEGLPYFRFFTEHHKFVLYGEWLVKHTIDHYLDSAWRKFYIFDVWNGERFLSYDEYEPRLKQYGLLYIPCIKKIKNGSWENFLHEAKTCRYLLKDGVDKPGEGIVIKNYEWSNAQNKQVWAKIVNSEFKTDHIIAMGAPEVENKSNAAIICEKACTDALIEKEYAKIVNDVGEWNNKYIPRLLHTVYYSVVTEELWDCLKTIKKGLVNFKELEQLCILRVKAVKKELFQ